MTQVFVCHISNPFGVSNEAKLKLEMFQLTLLEIGFFLW